MQMCIIKSINYIYMIAERKHACARLTVYKKKEVKRTTENCETNFIQLKTNLSVSITLVDNFLLDPFTIFCKEKAHYPEITS